MKIFYRMPFLMFLFVAGSLDAQMKRVICTYNNAPTSSVQNTAVAGFTSSVTSCSVDTILLTSPSTDK